LPLNPTRQHSGFFGEIQPEKLLSRTFS
jgi:hypothetical protein